MSADIDKCETEGLGTDGEDGCQREDRSAIDPQLCTSLAPLLFVFSILGCSTFFSSRFLSLLFTAEPRLTDQNRTELAEAKKNRAPHDATSGYVTYQAS